jgi:hypothetical protein
MQVGHIHDGGGRGGVTTGQGTDRRLRVPRVPSTAPLCGEQNIPSALVRVFAATGADLIMASGTFTFISTGLTTALERAKAAAKGKNILAHSPDIAQQLLRAGLLDEIQLHLAPILLGAGRESPIVTQRTGRQAARCLVSRTRRGRPSGRPPRSHR